MNCINEISNLSLFSDKHNTTDINQNTVNPSQLHNIMNHTQMAQNMFNPTSHKNTPDIYYCDDIYNEMNRTLMVQSMFNPIQNRGGNAGNNSTNEMDRTFMVQSMYDPVKNRGGNAGNSKNEWNTDNK